MNTEIYLNRINFVGEIKPNLKFLAELQKSHLFNVPFENLDIHNKIPILLDIDRIYEKIVLNNRGGFCYELNGLFYELLIALNFDAKRISARVFKNELGYSPEFDHMAIIVKIENSEYLVDVGFGDFIFEPLKLELGRIQHDPSGNYQIDKFDEQYYRVSKFTNNQMLPEYIFTKIERELVEFSGMCKYHQTDPNSHFMQKRLISVPTENGRVTITGNRLKINNNNSVTEKELKDEIEFKNELLNLYKLNE